MSASTKRAWKLQEFVAHGANVNCLALGHKSGRVLVTGGDDKKVNLWAVGKPNCIMSLCGHTTAVECVRFGHTEELVCAGSQSGALKIWDLEAARLVRTLTGHKSGIKCIDFHPYGDFLSSGSNDTNLKLWDIRRKGCIFTYKGHNQTINSLKFSPDGQWIATAGEEGAVKMWDLRAGKLMTEFHDHGGPVHDVEFHPHEFLLASGSHDRTVNFWDLESFQLICSTERETAPVKCIYFHPEGEALFSSTGDSLRVHGWEPCKTYDTLPMGWGKVKDIATASQQLIGAACQQSHVSLYVVDLKRVAPFSGKTNAGTNANITFRPGQTVRRSFIKDPAAGNGNAVNNNGKDRRAQVKISEEAASDKSGTDPEDSDAVSTADITDVTNYENIFCPRQRELNRTPPLDPFEPPPTSDAETSLRPEPAARPSRHSRPDRPSPSPTRRTSQPTLPSSTFQPEKPVPEYRRGSNAGLPDPPRPRLSTSQPRPMSVHDPASLYDLRGGGGRDLPASPVRATPPSPVRGSYRTSVNLSACRDAPEQEFLPAGPQRQQPRAPPQPVAARTTPDPPYRDHQPYASSPPKPLHPVPTPTKGYPSPPTREGAHHRLSEGGPPTNPRVSEGPSQHRLSPGGPLDRPALVRPGTRNTSSDRGFREQTGMKQQNNSSGNYKTCGSSGSSTPEEKIDLVPMVSDKPTGLKPEDFLSKTFGGCRLQLSPAESDKFGGFGQASDLSESEVTSSILKGHDNMMAVLTARGRNIEIIRKLWQGKDAKTAVEQAVAVNDQAVMVDLLSVIVLRPSIWNLDLCTTLLPPIGDLLQSKYESYINAACGALKLILKKFAPVIKSNIDNPGSSVGVDISREERANKCMQCYKDLVKIRSFILKRQTMQGKVGHVYRELGILMQYLD
jgi:katanin p80 WD40 repeat-containing subunit B1